MLVAVTVYVPAADGTNAATRPAGSSEPPAGVARQVTPPAQLPWELSVAVNVELCPAVTLAGLAVTDTAVTVQGFPPPPPHALPMIPTRNQLLEHPMVDMTPPHTDAETRGETDHQNVTSPAD